MNLSDKLSALETLASEVLDELETMPSEADTRHSKYAQPNGKLIAAQIVFHIRILLDKHGEKK